MQDAVDEGGAVFGGLQAVDEHHHLVAAQAGEGVFRAQLGLDAPAHLDEELVAGGMSVLVVDALESIEVEVAHGQELAPALRLHDALHEAVCQQAAVGQAGEAVVERDVLQLLFVRLDLADVADDHV